MSKYKEKDIILFNGNRAIIKGVEKDFLLNKYKLTIEFENEKLIPKTMKVYDNEVTLLQRYLECPLCGNEYKVTKSPVLGEHYYDCLKCGMKKEDIDSVVKKEETNNGQSLFPYWYDEDFDLPF